ncbi:hypothetical protein V2W45_1471720 [Cenococcum geophilum]
MICCCLLCFAVTGFRAKQLRFNNLLAMDFIRPIVVTLYMLAVAFVIAAAIVESGLGLCSFTICRTAILICLVFYVSSKVTIAHVLRAPYLRRAHDWIWLARMIVVASGFGTIIVFAFIYPLTDLSTTDGKCRIGFPLKERPDSDYLYPINKNFPKSVEMLLWKFLIGSALLMLLTVASLGLLYHMKGRELQYAYLTVLTWAVCIIRWLTVDSIEIDGRTMALLIQSDIINPRSTGAGISL